MFGRSATAIASSKVAVSSRDGAVASSACSRAITVATGVRLVAFVVLAMRSRISRVPASFGASFNVRCASKSDPVHNPATVGRSWVVMALSACSGKVEGERLLEPDQPIRQDPPRGELGSSLVFNRPEILADDGGPRALALEGHDGEEVARRRSHVGALRRLRSDGNPEQPEQAPSRDRSVDRRRGAGTRGSSARRARTPPREAWPARMAAVPSSALAC